jgi:hypothetical protein
MVRGASVACRGAVVAVMMEPFGSVDETPACFLDPFRCSMSAPGPAKRLRGQRKRRWITATRFRPCRAHPARWFCLVLLNSPPRASASVTAGGSARTGDRDTGRHQISTGAAFQFGMLPPARYRVFCPPWHSRSRHPQLRNRLDAHARVSLGRVHWPAPSSGGRIRPSHQVSVSAISARARRRIIGVRG